MSWRCPNCGYEPIPDDLDTCPQCGYIIQMKSEAERESVEKVMEKEVETKERMKEIPVEKEAASIEVTEEKELPTEEKVFKLTVISSAIPEFKGKTFELPLNVFTAITIGRGPENVLSIPDPYISWFHLRILRKNNEYYIEDVGSSNGTYIFDKDEQIFKKIEPKTMHKVRDGDLIKIGISTIVKLTI